MSGDDLDVVAQQIAFRELRLRPEHLREIGDAQAARRRAARWSPSLRASSSALQLIDDRASRDASAFVCARAVASTGQRRACLLVDRAARVPSLTDRLASSASPAPRARLRRLLVVAQARDTPDGAACRRSVHSVNRTCATRSGCTQCAGSFVLIGVGERRLVDLARLEQLPDALQLLPDRSRCRCVRPSVSAPSSRRSTPSSSAPKCERVCRGSVQPPTTNSCSWTSFSFRHAGVRRPL